jgi:hypothetical protein
MLLSAAQDMDTDSGILIQCGLSSYNMSGNYSLQANPTLCGRMSKVVYINDNLHQRIQCALEDGNATVPITCSSRLTNSYGDTLRNEGRPCFVDGGCKSAAVSDTIGSCTSNENDCNLNSMHAVELDLSNTGRSSLEASVTKESSAVSESTLSANRADASAQVGTTSENGRISYITRIAQSTDSHVDHYTESGEVSRPNLLLCV